jgi:hypothetical protein
LPEDDEADELLGLDDFEAFTLVFLALTVLAFAFLAAFTF